MKIYINFTGPLYCIKYKWFQYLNLKFGSSMTEEKIELSDVRPYFQDQTSG